MRRTRLDVGIGQNKGKGDFFWDVNQSLSRLHGFVVKQNDEKQNENRSIETSVSLGGGGWQGGWRGLQGAAGSSIGTISPAGSTE